jgi:hypothetical protein
MATLGMGVAFHAHFVGGLCQRNRFVDGCQALFVVFLHHQLPPQRCQGLRLAPAVADRLRQDQCLAKFALRLPRVGEESTRQTQIGAGAALDWFVPRLIIACTSPVPWRYSTFQA